MSSKECASIMDTLALSEPVTTIPEYVESVCRKTVQTVSNRSKYVSYDSIFEIYSEYWLGYYILVYTKNIGDKIKSYLFFIIKKDI